MGNFPSALRLRRGRTLGHYGQDQIGFDLLLGAISAGFESPRTPSWNPRIGRLGRPKIPGLLHWIWFNFGADGHNEDQSSCPSIDCSDSSSPRPTHVVRTLVSRPID